MTRRSDSFRFSWLVAVLLLAALAFGLWRLWPLLPGWWAGLLALLDTQGPRLQSLYALFGLPAAALTILSLTLYQRQQSQEPAAIAREQARIEAERAEALAFLREGVHVHVHRRLEQLLFTRICVDLGRAPAPASVRLPWGRVLLHEDAPAERLPASRQTIDLFNPAHQGLLILGEPGAGKTVELLRLTAALLERAGAGAGVRRRVRLRPRFRFRFRRRYRRRSRCFCTCPASRRRRADPGTTSATGSPGRSSAAIACRTRRWSPTGWPRAGCCR